MKHADPRPYADPTVAARKLLELAVGVLPVNDRIHIEKINGPFLSWVAIRELGTPRGKLFDVRWLGALSWQSGPGLNPQVPKGGAVSRHASQRLS